MTNTHSAVVMIYNGEEAERNDIAVILSMLKDRGILKDGDIIVKTFNENDLHNILLGSAVKAKKVEIKVDEPTSPKVEALTYLGKIFKHMMKDLNDDVDQVVIYMERRYARGIYNETDTVFCTAMDTISSFDFVNEFNNEMAKTIKGYGFDVNGFFTMLRHVDHIKLLLSK